MRFAVGEAPEEAREQIAEEQAAHGAFLHIPLRVCASAQPSLAHQYLSERPLQAAGLSPFSSKSEICSMVPVVHDCCTFQTHALTRFSEAFSHDILKEPSNPLCCLHTNLCAVSWSHPRQAQP